jgi:lincosamide nucleotidyltransferase A/C/D/E
MELAEVVGIYGAIEREGVDIWIDGGWCVDALVGRHTRDHVDLDIAVARGDEDRLRRALDRMGFTDATDADAPEGIVVMASPHGWNLDVHVFQYDAEGRVVYGIDYPYGALTGRGSLAGLPVRCVAPEWMFRFKTSYPPAPKDRADVRLLAETFGFALPEAYSSVDEGLDTR